MKTEIEIVTGFLGAGKTTFINALIRTTLTPKEKIMVLQCERGQEQICEDVLRGGQVVVKTLESQKKLTSEYVRHLIQFHKPHRIIVEQNGTAILDELFDIFYDKKVNILCNVSTIYHIADALTFEIYLHNMGYLLLPSIYNSNLIVVTNTAYTSDEEMENIIKRLEALNSYAFILPVRDRDTLEEALLQSKLLDNGLLKRFKIYVKEVLWG